MAAIGLSAATMAPAYAAPTSSEETADEVVQMEILGYDEEIAAEHGFEIVVDENGQEQTVPVTDEARAIVANYDYSVIESGGIGAQDVRVGPCGTSSLFLARAGSSGINIATAYSVYTTSISHRWQVSGATNSGVYVNDFSGLNASNTWNATHFQPVGSNQSGWGQVTSDSYAVLINGAICGSLQPRDDL